MSGGKENRREFVTRSVTAAALAAASYNRVLGANGRVRVANVGCGRRGLLRELIQIKDDAQLEVSAVCDTWRQKREKAQQQVKEFTGQTPFATGRIEDVLNRKDIDAVVIGTPDHLHCTQLVEAIRAGSAVPAASGGPRQYLSLEGSLRHAGLGGSGIRLSGGPDGALLHDVRQWRRELCEVVRDPRDSGCEESILARNVGSVR